MHCALKVSTSTSTCSISASASNLADGNYSCHPRVGHHVVSMLLCQCNLFKLVWRIWHLDGIAVILARDELHLSPALWAAKSNMLQVEAVPGWFKTLCIDVASSNRRVGGGDSTNRCCQWIKGGDSNDSCHRRLGHAIASMLLIQSVLWGYDWRVSMGLVLQSWLLQAACIWAHRVRGA